MRKHVTQAAGIVVPRFRRIGADEIVRADRIEKAGPGYLQLSCGLRVVPDDKVLENGPSNTGDYMILDDGDDAANDKLVRGAEFVTQYARIPQGLDIPTVSAALEPQAGSVNQPVNAADPEHPVNANQVATPASNAEAVTEQFDQAARDGAEHHD